MRIYISGPIRNTSDYMERFARAEMRMKALGYDVINPTCLSAVYSGLTDEEYLKIDLELLSCCDAIYMQDGYTKSVGAMAEWRLAKKLGLRMIYEEET